jgi:hypothetical protein
MSFEQKWTREYYVQRKPWLTKAAQRLWVIKESIRFRIIRQVALTLPKSDRPTDDALRCISTLSNNDIFMQAFMNRDMSSQWDKILRNCIDTSWEQLLGCIDTNPVVRFLNELLEASHKFGTNTLAQEFYINLAAIYISDWIKLGSKPVDGNSLPNILALWSEKLSIEKNHEFEMQK